MSISSTNSDASICASLVFCIQKWHGSGPERLSAFLPPDKFINSAISSHVYRACLITLTASINRLSLKTCSRSGNENFLSVSWSLNHTTSRIKVPQTLSIYFFILLSMTTPPSPQFSNAKSLCISQLTHIKSIRNKFHSTRRKTNISCCVRSVYIIIWAHDMRQKSKENTYNLPFIRDKHRLQLTSKTVKQSSRYIWTQSLGVTSKL
jgi:hypothetical protein